MPGAHPEGGIVPLVELSKLMAMSHCDFDSLRLPLHAGVCVFVCVGRGLSRLCMCLRVESKLLRLREVVY